RSRTTVQISGIPHYLTKTQNTREATTPLSDTVDRMGHASCSTLVWLTMKTLTLTLVVALTMPLVVSSRGFFQWFSPASCCRWRRSYCCPRYHHNTYQGEEVSKRPWPLLTNKGLSEEQLNRDKEERRARRERYREREMNRDSRRRP
ncbi:hypothetical protein Hamer_G004124, partial [Homarus americanus]